MAKAKAKQQVAIEVSWRAIALGLLVLELRLTYLLFGHCCLLVLSHWQFPDMSDYYKDTRNILQIWFGMFGIHFSQIGKTWDRLYSKRFRACQCKIESEDTFIPPLAPPYPKKRKIKKNLPSPSRVFATALTIDVETKLQRFCCLLKSCSKSLNANSRNSSKLNALLYILLTICLVFSRYCHTMLPLREAKLTDSR